MEVNLKRRKSKIWNYFTILNDATASCNYCQHLLSYKSTTGNLKKHLERKHSTTVKSPKQIFPHSSNEISEPSEPYTVLYMVSDESEPPTLCAEDSDILTTQTSLQESTSSQNEPHEEETFLIKLPHLQDTADREDENHSKEKRSTTWKYFTPQNENTAVCNLCQKHLSYKTSISNLKKHYQKQHSSKSINEKMKLLTHRSVNSLNKVDECSFNSPMESSHSAISTSSMKKSPKICKTSPSVVSNKVLYSNLKTSKVDEILLKMITTDLLPIELVEANGFKQFTRALNPLYTLPTEKKLSTELIPTKFKEITVKIHRIIEKVKSVTLTTDCWTSNHNESFIRVLAHFINDDYERKSILLAVQSCNLPLSAKCLNELLENVVERWDLKEKVLLVISDDVTDLQDEDLQWPHLKCIVSIIGSIIQDSLQEVEALLDTISNIVSLVKTKIATIGQLKHFLNVYKRLTPCTSNHWSSVLDMLKGVKEFQEEIWTTLSSLGEENLSGWTYEKFEMVGELVQILQPMESIMEVVKKEKITLSLIIVLCNGLLDNYNSLTMTKSFSNEIEPVVKVIIDNLNARFSNLETIPTLLISSFLDPRFKHVGFSNDSLVNKAKSLVSENWNVLKEDKTEKLRSISLDNEPHLIWDSFDKKVATFDSSANSSKSRGIVELDRYLEEPLLNRNEDPLQWWKTNAYNFPFLSDLIKLKFGSVATAFPYKMCCKDEQSLTERRNSLPSTNIEKILFIGYNFSV